MTKNTNPPKINQDRRLGDILDNTTKQAIKTIVDYARANKSNSGRLRELDIFSKELGFIIWNHLKQLETEKELPKATNLKMV